MIACLRCSGQDSTNTDNKVLIYLFEQDKKAQMYYTDNISLRIERNALSQKNAEQDAKITDYKDLVEKTTEENQVSLNTIGNLQSEMKFLEKKNVKLKIGIFSISVLAVSEILYFSFKH